MVHQRSQADIDFRRAFEAFEVAPAAFDHAAHVRLAYVYLCESPVDEATQRMKHSLLAFLDHLGVGRSKFHETITRAWILAVRHFMARSAGADSAQAFIAAHPRLLDSRIMLTHYSAGQLFSDAARTAFVAPDLAPIPVHA